MQNFYIRQVKMNEYNDSSYISQLPVVKHLRKNDKLDFDSEVTFFVGENGAGKSTLIEAIAVCAGFNGEGGSKNFNFSTKQTVSNLSDHLTLIKGGYEKDGFFLRAESFYNVASQVEELDLNLDEYGGKSLHCQSHGESFLALVQNRFRGNGLYILDEPEAALSPSRQMTLLAEIKALVDCNSQFIIATHSPILLAYPNATIYQITDDGMNRVNYEDTDSYILTKQFLERPHQMIKYLFDSIE